MPDFPSGRLIISLVTLVPLHQKSVIYIFLTLLISTSKRTVPMPAADAVITPFSAESSQIITTILLATVCVTDVGPSGWLKRP